MAAMLRGSEPEPERTTFIVVRHGQSQDNAEMRFGGDGPAPLTDLGRRQAEVTAATLAALDIDAVVSSDLVRARATGQAIADACGRELSLDEGLRERSLGRFNGLLFSEFSQDFPDDWRRLRAGDATYEPRGGESIDAVYARVSRSLDLILADHRGKRVVVVSHGVAIFHAFAHICGLGSPSRGLGVFLLVDNCSLSTFVDTGDRWLIKAINDRAHLGELATREPYRV